MTREEAINLLHILLVTVFEKDYDEPFRDAIFMAIEALQERPNGRWDKGECTNCGHYVGSLMTDYYDYCPRCGNDNRGEGE